MIRAEIVIEMLAYADDSAIVCQSVAEASARVTAIAKGSTDDADGKVHTVKTQVQRFAKQDPARNMSAAELESEISRVIGQGASGTYTGATFAAYDFRDQMEVPVLVIDIDGYTQTVHLRTDITDVAAAITALDVLQGAQASVDQGNIKLTSDSSGANSAVSIAAASGEHAKALFGTGRSRKGTNHKNQCEYCFSIQANLDSVEKHQRSCGEARVQLFDQDFTVDRILSVRGGGQSPMGPYLRWYQVSWKGHRLLNDTETYLCGTEPGERWRPTWVREQELTKCGSALSDFWAGPLAEGLNPAETIENVPFETFQQGNVTIESNQTWFRCVYCNRFCKTERKGPWSLKSIWRHHGPAFMAAQASRHRATSMGWPLGLSLVNTTSKLRRS